MKVVERSASVPLGADGSLKLAVVADTHSSPHPNLEKLLRQLRPDAILHAGDIGDLEVLDPLRALAPVYAVRGNIDVYDREIPDHSKLEIVSRAEGDGVLLRILLTHIALNGPKLRVDAARRARKDKASLVVCGHSHIPFIGKDGELLVFNPGSAGPRRFTLPIVFGVISIGGGSEPSGRVRFEHTDLETGRAWVPPGFPARAVARQ